MVFLHSVSINSFLAPFFFPWEFHFVNSQKLPTDSSTQITSTICEVKMTAQKQAHSDKDFDEN